MEQPSQTPTIIQGTENVANAVPTVGEAATAAIAAKPPLPKKRKANANGKRRTSFAWEHFTRTVNEDNEPIAVCNYCNKKYRSDSKQHGTTNLNAHKKVCPNNPDNINRDPSQPTLTFKSGEGGSLVPTSTRFNFEACKKALAAFVIIDEQPFRVVEGEGFKYLLKQLQPQFTPPSRRTVARHCFQMYLDLKGRLKALFKSDCSRVALTSDCWTSIQNLHYMTLTAHFIDSDWKYQKRILSFSVVPNSKGDTIGRKIEEILREWGIRNVSTITVDNASSNDVGVAYLKKRVQNMNGLMYNGGFFHMRCAAHILNLVVKDGLQDIKGSISSVRNAVRFVRSSAQRSLKFKECIEFSGITCKKSLCLDVPTRWNSTYLMLDVAEKFQAAFDKLEGEDLSYIEYFGTDSSPPSAIDWENVRTFVKFLKIFYDATKVFSSSQQVTLHSVFHQLANIYCELKQSSMNLNTILATMGYEMKLKYDKYWGNITNINQLIYFGVIFDPRYKLRFVEWSFLDMYSNEADFAQKLFDTLKKNLFEVYNWYKSKFEGHNGVGQSSTSSLEGATQAENSVNVEIPSTLARSDAFKQHLREKDSIDKKNELERYLSEPCIDEGDKFEILLWWKQNASRYPIVSGMVREILATPISSVASESVFSTGGRVLDHFRSSLNPQMAEALICAQNWLRPSIVQFNDHNEEFEISEHVILDFQNISTETVGTVGAQTATAAGNGGASGSGSAGCASQSQPVNTGC